TPNYEAKVERCTIGAMAPFHPPPPAAPPPRTGIGMLDAMNERTPLVRGFRMIGAYAGASGLKLQFDNRAVTLDSRRAHAKAPYSVENTSGGFVVHVQAVGGAFELAVAPDGALRGAGTTSVNGRLVTAIRGDDVSFASVSETCPVDR